MSLEEGYRLGGKRLILEEQFADDRRVDYELSSL